MAHGREDFTLLADTDIIAQTIGEIAVDIAAQTIGEIAVDIAAQTIGNLAVNIAASAVTMDINIKTQDITINIDINAQTVGVLDQPQWQVEAGKMKSLYGSATAVPSGNWGTVYYYTVPAGKTFYITDFGALNGNVVANVNSGAWLARGGHVMYVGGRFGCHHTLAAPKKVLAGQDVTLYSFNGDAGAQTVKGWIGGFEV